MNRSSDTLENRWNENIEWVFSRFEMLDDFERQFDSILLFKTKISTLRSNDYFFHYDIDNMINGKYDPNNRDIKDCSGYFDLNRCYNGLPKSKWKKLMYPLSTLKRCSKYIKKQITQKTNTIATKTFQNDQYLTDKNQMKDNSAKIDSILLSIMVE